jgi:hypothetical protein
MITFNYNTRWDLIQKMSDGAPLSPYDRALMNDLTRDFDEIKSDFDALSALIMQEVAQAIGGRA